MNGRDSGQWRSSNIAERREHRQDCSAAGAPAGRPELWEFCSGQSCYRGAMLSTQGCAVLGP